MNKNIQQVTESLTAIFEATDEALNEWVGDGCLQIPNLIVTLALKLNWNEKQIRENDPIVRYYIRNNPEWHVTRGAHGGIMRTTDKQQKENAKAAKLAVKPQVQAAIEAKAALSTQATSVITDDSTASI